MTSACGKSSCVCRVTSRPLAALPEMQESVVRKCGDELLALVRDAAIPDPPPPLPRRERPDPALLALVKRLADVSAEVAKSLDISAEVLATRRELEKLAAGKRDVSLLLALSGHQPNLPPGWTGGNRLAIHGTNAPGTVGAAASAGCLRAGDADLRVLMARVPLGTPVFIHG